MEKRVQVNDLLRRVRRPRLLSVPERGVRNPYLRCGVRRYDFAVKNFFPPDGNIPDEMLFTNPQYNTWIELMYDQNQADILKYADGIIGNNFPAGVIMIDDNWQENYGKWKYW